MHQRLIFTAALFSTASAAFAGPLNPAHVAHDARWLVHVDVELFVQSKVGTCMLESHEGLDMEGIDEIKEALGIDVLTDVLGVTLYSGGDDGHMGLDMGVDDDEVHIGAEAEGVHSAVAVAVMTGAADNMIEKLKQDASYAEVRKDGYVLHSFVEPESDERHNVYIQQGAKADQRLVVAGPEIERVVAAINVVSGKSASLRGADAALGAIKPRGGSFLFSTALEIDGLGGGDDPASRILDCSRQITIDVGEADDSAYAFLEVAADTEQDALNISQILQGLVALGRMAIAHHHENNAHAVKLLNAISFQTRDDVIIAGASISTEECCELIRMAAEEHEHHENGDDEDDDDDEIIIEEKRAD